MRPSRRRGRVGADPSTVYAWLHVAAPELVRQYPVLAVRPAWSSTGRHTRICWVSTSGRMAAAAPGNGWSLNVACCDAYPGLMAECETSMRAVLARAPAGAASGLSGHQGLLPPLAVLLPQHGPRPQARAPIRLERWQQDVVAEHPGRLLRGLFHSDGWRGDNVAVHRKGGTSCATAVRGTSSRPQRRHPAHLHRRPRPAGRGLAAQRPGGSASARRGAVAALDQHVGLKY
jgi:hypothetical protein